MNARQPGPRAAVTASPAPDFDDNDRRSPASAVCYMNMDDEAPEPPVQTSTPPNPSRRALAEQGPSHEGTRSPGKSACDEQDKTPRSERPPSVATSALHLMNSSSDPEPSYFSPRPIRPYTTRLPSSTPASARPSPTASIEPLISSTSSTPAASQSRPPVYRDDSSASSASVSTVRARTVDPSQVFATPSRAQLDGPHYPNQSYAALQYPLHSSAYYQPVRSRGDSYRSHFSSLSAAHINTTGIASDGHRDIMDSGSRTVGNSPASSPGLFSPSTPPLHHVHQSDDGYYSSPYLHHTHRQPPKETHVADIVSNPNTGRKTINQYEVMDELGRGVHGKVKLGRNMDTGQTVAIKIVERYSKRRRLNKDSKPEDKIKKEIAILKKARHPNIVSLLEVIDDPKWKKVYIVLEHVELGEVKWRTEGEKEVCLIEWRRYQREKLGAPSDENDALEDEKIIAKAHQKLKRQQRQKAKLMSYKRRLGLSENEPWSLEHGGDSDEDGSLSTRSSRASTVSGSYKMAEQWAKGVHHEVNMETAVRALTAVSTQQQEPPAPTGLEGTMYGAYDADPVRGRTPSVADSNSSRFTNPDDEVPEHFRHVPLLTLQTALEAFRDTLLGLEFLHFQEVIHRDIKPANLLQTKEHRIKISDFGVSYLGRARQPSDDNDQSESDMQDAEAIELAKTVGTPAFYAPELCKIDDGGDAFPVTKQIDIWALGVTLYCLIYGRVPFYHHNEYALMRQIVEEDVFIPKYRLKAVTEQSGSRPSSHGRLYHSMSTEKRAPHELEYEEVDDVLQDLLKRLLTKDPRKRITIPEIKRHPWVVQGLDNLGSWVDDTDPARTTQGKRIEVSNEDMEKAVVPITFVDRVRSGVRKTLDTITSFGRRGASRKRAQSTATSPDQPQNISAHSSSSTISQDGRRPSLPMTQTIFEALNRSRDTEHPLSQSVSASPEARERAKFFDPSSRTTSPAHNVERSAQTAPLAGPSRPFNLERAHSTMSSAASVRTIKQSDVSSSSRPFSPHGPATALPSNPTVVDTPGGSGLSNLWGGRLIRDMRSRERLVKPSKRSQDFARANSEHPADTYADPHSCPSIALSTTSAAGQVDQPDMLKDLSPGLTRSPRFASADVDPIERASSRQSSVSSTSSYMQKGYASYGQPDVGVVHSTEASPYIYPWETSDEKPSLSKRTSMQQRITEETEGHEKSSPPPLFPLVHTGVKQSDRPPSPIMAALGRLKVEDYLRSEQIQPYSHAPPADDPKPLVSSSSEDYFGAMSQSTSNPSIPSVESASSSVGAEDYKRLIPSTTSSEVALSRATSDQYETPTDDLAGYDGDRDHPLESDEDDSDDNFILMAKKKPAPAPQSATSTKLYHSKSVGSSKAYISEPASRGYRPERRRSARSGSNGTVKKIQIPGVTEPEQNKEGS